MISPWIKKIEATENRMAHLSGVVLYDRKVAVGVDYPALPSLELIIYMESLCANPLTKSLFFS